MYTELPLKNVALALLFAALLGPIGLLYSTFWGGFCMILVAFVVVAAMYPVPIIIMWLLCCVWSVGAVNRYNKKLLKQKMQAANDTLVEPS
jgi:hypothetical protein